MSNIVTALKEEIVRLARKEIRVELEGLKKASGQYRSEIFTIKRRVADLEKMVSRLNRKANAEREAKTIPGAATNIRFSAKGLISTRQRLGLSAAKMGALVGVSAQTIYNWESEKIRPRKEQLAAIASLRGLGKKQVAAKLEHLAS